MIKDLKGNIVPFGKTKKTIEENFFEGNLPYWLTIETSVEGSYTINNLTNSYGNLILETGTTTNVDHKINLFPNGVDFSKIKEINFTISNLVFNKPEISLFIDIQNSARTNGINFKFQRFLSAEFGVLAKNNSAAVFQPINNYYIMDNNEYKRRRNLKFRIRSNNSVILEENNNVIWEYKFTDTELNLNDVLFPMIIIQNRSVNDIAKMEISKIECSIYHN